ncbi:MAG TPA: helicase-related protein, partial [Candidatus Dormibacteraeota bacterium]|nr:helicase-related protein [Candidatus Dormibacteraeota bacterium]
IDEQHRFGVEQRARLRAKGGAPHTLHLTATPIPRTLAQTLLAGLDISSIDELPPGRTPIESFVLRASRLPRAYAFIREEVERRRRQAYVVCAAIESDDEEGSELVGAVEEAARLASGPLEGLRLGLLHGRMKSALKDRTMRAFVAGEIDVLVATTVVEVGVDVPNANVMLVLDAHRYGLAQLHQLRGRVGRGAAASYCLLVHPDAIEQSARLETLLATSDGFEIAERDLELRGGGQIGGILQSGHQGMRFGDPLADRTLFLAASQCAREIHELDPALLLSEHRGLKDALLAEPNLRDLQLSS